MGSFIEDIARHLVHIWQADEHRRLIHHAKSDDEEIRRSASLLKNRITLHMQAWALQVLR